MAVNLSGLNNFKNKVESFRSLDGKLVNTIADEIASAGVTIAQGEYSGHSSISVNKTKASQGRASVVAKGKNVAYLEFGTGAYADGTYEGNLPQIGVPITGKWEYYYDSEHKTEKNGVKGWNWGKQFLSGKPAGNQMYRTSRLLRGKVKSIFKNKIKGAINKDV